MTRYRVLAWREIPTQIEATDASGAVVKRPMPRWFMQEISRITMREGLAGTDEYLAEFAWTEDVEQRGHGRRGGGRRIGRALCAVRQDAGGPAHRTDRRRRRR